MSYVDGFVIPLPRSRVEEYRRLARKAGRIWREHGALEFRECVLDDPRAVGALSFPKGVRAKPGETVLFSWIVFKSKAHRDRVNAKVMKDARLAGMSVEQMPFDCARMLYGGFKVLVEA